MVDRLLGDDYVDEYARNWTTLWTNVLIGRSGGTERSSLVNREGLQQSLRRAFRGNMPYDRLVLELISAKGVSKPGEDGFNGFVNFLAGNLEENGVQATAKTSQVFLGLQVQCTQCHNHPFNDWKQNQFWEMNAFFRQTRALRRFDRGATRQIESVELVNQDFAGENNMPEEGGFVLRAAQRLVEGRLSGVRRRHASSKRDSGFVDDVDRRAELAKLIVGSEYLGKALVNRMWAHFLGYGFTKPIDDMGPHNPPSHPELLDALAGEFTSHGYNLKELIRWIISQRAVRPVEQDHRPQQEGRLRRLGEKPMFSHFYLRQMRAEELYESLLVATEADTGRARRRNARGGQARMAQAVHARLRHRRQRRNHDVQRHDSADVDDDERRLDQQGHQHRERQLLAPHGQRLETDQRRPSIQRLVPGGAGPQADGPGNRAGQRTDAAAARRPGRGAARRVVGRAQQQRIYFEPLEAIRSHEYHDRSTRPRNDAAAIFSSTWPAPRRWPGRPCRSPRRCAKARPI